jgi:hypothetical protein
MHNIKIRNENGMGRPSQILINDKEFPVTALQFNLDMENHNKAEISVLVHKCDFEVNANLVLNGVILGTDNELRLYEQLKEKFEPKVVGGLAVELKPTQNQIDRLTKRLLLEQSKRLEEKANEIGEHEWLCRDQHLPDENSKVELLINDRYIINATYIYGSFFRDSDDVLILPAPSQWRYKK